MTSPTEYLGKIYEDWDQGRQDVNAFFHCRSGKMWPCLRGDIALALLCLAMLFAFWGVWALTRQTHESGARIGRATPAQRSGNSTMHGSATGVITFSRIRLIADMLVGVGWLA